MTDTQFHHKSVLKSEVCTHLIDLNKSIIPVSSYNCENNHSINILDCTLGAAGHTIALMERAIDLNEFKNLKINLVGFDRDEWAIQHSSKKIESFKNKILLSYPNITINTNLFHCPFSKIGMKVASLGLNHFHAVLADLGVSSPQLDLEARGFSFSSKSPLDMRMDLQQKLNAFDVLSNYKENELSNIFFIYGEEPRSKILARKIVEERTKSLESFSSCEKFAGFIEKTLGYKNSRTHPATRIFQALRIEVNKEFEEIFDLFRQLPLVMSSFTRLGFISFHSLEDRMVKNAYRNWEKGLPFDTDKKYEFDVPIANIFEEQIKWGKELPRGGIVPSKLEIEDNPRARSSRLRVFEFHENYKPT